MEVLAPFHITVRNVQVENIDFQWEFMEVVNARIAAEQRVQQVTFEAEQARIKAQQDLEIRRLEAEAVLVAAEADAQALRFMQEALGDMGLEVRQAMLQQMAIEKWDGVMPKVVGGNDMGFIIDSILSDPVVE